MQVARNDFYPGSGQVSRYVAGQALKYFGKRLYDSYSKATSSKKQKTNKAYVQLRVGQGHKVRATKRKRKVVRKSLKKRVAKLEKANPKSTLVYKNAKPLGVAGVENKPAYAESGAWNTAVFSAMLAATPVTPTTSADYTGGTFATKSFPMSCYSEIVLRNNSLLACTVDVYIMTSKKYVGSSGPLTQMAAWDALPVQGNQVYTDNILLYPTEYEGVTKVWGVSGHKQFYLQPGDICKMAHTAKFHINETEIDLGNYIPKKTAVWVIRLVGGIGHVAATPSSAGYVAVAGLAGIIKTVVKTQYDGNHTGINYITDQTALSSALDTHVNLDVEDNEA